MRKGHPKVALTKNMSGDVLLSHKFSLAVPSALKGLTSGFGMEPGVSLSLWPPKLYGVISVTFYDRPPLSEEVDRGPRP